MHLDPMVFIQGMMLVVSFGTITSVTINVMAMSADLRKLLAEVRREMRDLYELRALLEDEGRMKLLALQAPVRRDSSAPSS